MEIINFASSAVRQFVIFQGGVQRLDPPPEFIIMRLWFLSIPPAYGPQIVLFSPHTWQLDRRRPKPGELSNHMVPWPDKRVSDLWHFLDDCQGRNTFWLRNSSQILVKAKISSIKYFIKILSCSLFSQIGLKTRSLLPLALLLLLRVKVQE